MTDYLKMLMRYKAWANDLVFDAVAKLPEAELTAPRKIFAGNLLRTLNHTYAMDDVWRAHLEGRPHGYAKRTPDDTPTLARLRDAQKAMDRWYVEYAEQLGVDKEAEVVQFRFIGGSASSMTRRDMLLHVANHGTYHRGNVASMMYEIGTPPPTTDLPVYLKNGG
jgi:uncharacterized damage-inducible protein DinB